MRRQANEDGFEIRETGKHSRECQPRVTMFPYCLQRVPGTKRIYRVLNREYQPLGFHVGGWAKTGYRDGGAPVHYRLKGLTPRRAKLLCHAGQAPEAPDAIWLYDDGCIPFKRSKAATTAYLERLGVLASLTLEPCTPTADGD